MTSSSVTGEGYPSPFLVFLDTSPRPDPASPPTESPEDQDTGDLSQGVDEDALEADDLDTDTVTGAD